MAMTCDHSASHSGEARYLRAAQQLRLVLVCDTCGAERSELETIDYAPHALRFVAHLAELTGRELGLDAAQIARVRFAALVCGMGREQISPEILNKQGQLTREERAEVARQPELGAALVGGASFDDIREWILCHRERPDGSGYPRGLTGDLIPLESRILSVTEAYAAMITDRPYRLARDHDGACAELSRCVGVQFDAEVVEAFVRASVGRDQRLATAVA